MQSAIPLETCVDPGKQAKRKLRFDTAARIMKVLQKQYKDVYFLDVPNVTGKDGSVDNTHPNDLGFTHMLDVITPKIKKILKKPLTIKEKSIIILTSHFVSSRI